MAIYQINAGPGTGKTVTSTTLGRMILERSGIPSGSTEEQTNIYNLIRKEIPPTKKVLFTAHTTTVRDTLRERLPPKSNVYTLHGIGQSQLIKLFGFQRKVNNRNDLFIAEITGQNLHRLPYQEKRNWVGVKKICTLLKEEYLEPTEENLTYLKTKYPELFQYSIPVDWKHRAKELLKRAAIPNKSVEFQDMTWLAAKHIRRPTYDVGIVDESQDLSLCTYTMLTAMCKDLIFCGDPNQAIDAWRGAHEDIFNMVLDKAEAVFPLKTTFRLPPNLITKANRLIPGSVLPGPNKIPGTEKNIGYTEFVNLIAKMDPFVDDKRNTLTMCRTNAPLISVALRLTKKGIPCRLADKDLAAKLTFKLKSLGCKDINHLESTISDHINSIQRRKNPLLLLIEEDFCDCLLEISVRCNSIGELETKIVKLCEANKTRKCHLLATIHKCKGLEAYHTFVLNPPIEHPLANQNPISMKQETNVHFVGITRSKRDLIWVRK